MHFIYQDTTDITILFSYLYNSALFSTIKNIRKACQQQLFLVFHVLLDNIAVA